MNTKGVTRFFDTLTLWLALKFGIDKEHAQNASPNIRLHWIAQYLAVFLIILAVLAGALVFRYLL
jgi:hypothetical protein